jgi:hypothetical protein
MTPNSLSPLCEGRIDTIWSYISGLFELGWVFILASLIIAMLTALVTLWKSIRAPAKNKGLVPEIATTLDSLKSLIVALIDAPAWFAIFLAGVALIWLATSVVPNICDLSASAMPPSSKQSQTVN